MDSSCAQRARWTVLLLACLALLAGLAGAMRAIAPARVDAGDLIYVYDDVGRLVSAVDSTNTGVTYRYDAVGNLLGIARGGSNGPSISSISPTGGATGTVVTIAGAGFSAVSAETRVTFNGVPAVVSSSTTTGVVTSVPPAATTGPLTVTTPTGVARSAISFTVTNPDLAVTALNAPTSASPRQTISVGWTVANKGTGTAKPSWTDTVYLSQDSVCCHADRAVAVSETTSALGPGQSYTRTRSITIPPAQLAGQYFLLAAADSGRAVPEAGEANNARAVPITITRADLEPTALSAPSRVVIGHGASGSWTAVNQGPGIAIGNWVDELFISPTATCCNGARSLGTQARSGHLAAGASYTASKPFVVPDLPPGPYTLFVSIDQTGGVAEASEENNRRAIPVTITAPDLAPVAWTAPGSITTEQEIAVSWTVENRGDGVASAAWKDRIYLGTTEFCCGGTVLAAVSRSTSLAPGASYKQTRAVTVPGVPPGRYFLYVNANDGLALHESDVTNNHRMIPVTVTAPDLAAASLTAPASARAGQTVTLAWTVQNLGDGSARPPWTDALYLSGDRTCCAGDTLLASVARTASLAAGASYAATKSVVIPSKPAGTYHLILRADNGRDVYETDEVNNQRVVSFTIAP